MSRFIGAACADPNDRGAHGCWDHYASAIHDTATDQRYFAAVCDGVSTAPKGGDAAALACDLMTDAFMGLPEGVTLTAAVRHLLLTAHDSLEETFHGAGLCSVVIVVGSSSARRFAVSSVGDSQAILFDCADVKLLLEPDRDVRVRKVGKDTALSNGMPVIDRGLSQAIGQLGAPVIINTCELPFPPDGGILCLTSDGVRLGQLRQFLRTVQFEAAEDDVRSFCQRASQSSMDDACMVMWTLAEPSSLTAMRESLSSYPTLNSGDRGRLLAGLRACAWRPAAALVKCLYLEDDEGLACQLLELVTQSFHQPQRQELIDILDRHAKNGRRVIARALSDAIRRSAP